ncbi:patatin-like phospholipase family protein [Marinicella sp. W31]|uniref:patatin-like phospholipase family protein n=1 Tax=Marinicella sp. W31 TaxID=3023713 RepID=UPI003757F868
MKRTLLILLIIHLTTLAVFAQKSSTDVKHDPNRPKIGLALSGGGARGLAHIGVLKALEEKNIPIDYIAGTSMGSIVGGLYATGMNARDLEWAMATVDWEASMRPSGNRKLKNYGQRQEEKDYFVDLSIGLSKDGPKSGAGLVGGQRIMLELQRVVGSIQPQKFDEFPIPFRAVATDLNAGEPYIIDHGDLAMAMRASMSVPVLLGPVKHQGRMLVDGGILNNLPVDVVRDMGADIVIAVNISSPLGKVSENSSVLSLTYQSVDVALVQNTIESLGKADIVIAPLLEDVTSSDFDQTARMLTEGYEAVMSKSLMLDNFSLTPEQYQVELEVRNFLPRDIPSSIQFIEFTGNDRTSEKRLRGLISDLIGQNFNIADVQAAADRIAALEEDISVVSYQTVKRNGDKGIQFQITEKQWGPDYLKFGLKIADDFDSNTRISVLARHHRYNINSLGGQWINDFSVGSVLGWHSELLQPLDYNSRYFASANVQVTKDTRRLFDNTDEFEAIGEYDYKQFALGLDFGLNPNANSELRAGLWFQDESVVSVINDSDFDTAINRTLGLKVRYGLDTLDKAIFARDGYDIKAELGIFDRIQWLSFNGYRRFPLGRTSAAHVGIKADFTDLVDDGEFFKAYGGLDDFAGFPEHSLLGLNAFIFELGGFTALDMIDLPIFGSPNLIVKGHYGNVWQRNITVNNMIYGYSAGLSVDIENTVMYLGTGYSNADEFRFYLRLGTGF